MKHSSIACLILSAAALTVVGRADEPAPGDGPGWTGATHPEDVIAARRALMAEIELRMLPIDGYTVGDPAEPDALRDAAASIAAMLEAFPHLFPPTTDRYDAEAEEPETLALPAVWENFEAFYAMAASSAAAAEAMAGTADPEELREAARTLRGACDGCHAAYLKPYEPPKPSAEDLEFDFDSVFGR